MSVISRPWYARYDQYGNELADVRWLRVGRKRWYIETGKWGVVARFGSIHFTTHYDPAEEE